MARYERFYTYTNSKRRFRQKRGWVQKPLDRSVLNPYTYYDYYVVSSSNPDPYYPTSLAYQRMIAEWDSFGGLYARSYDSLLRQASGGARAALAITLFEWRSSFKMIFEAGRSVYESLRYLRRGDLYNSLRELGIRDRRFSRKLQRQHDSGMRLDNLWLEYNFGWAPLLEDIKKACQVLAQEIPTKNIRASSSAPLFFENKTVSPDAVQVESCLARRKLVLTSSVRATNPNLLLAKQLGITNPLQVAWDAIPFSFVIDWFLPVNKFVASFDLGLGISLNTMVASKLYDNWGSYTATFKFDPSRNAFEQSKVTRFERSVGGSLSLPRFSDRLEELHGSWWRAATSVALVSQQLVGVGANSRLPRH